MLRFHSQGLGHQKTLTDTEIIRLFLQIEIKTRQDIYTGILEKGSTQLFVCRGIDRQCIQCNKQLIRYHLNPFRYFPCKWQNLNPHLVLNLETKKNSTIHFFYKIHAILYILKFEFIEYYFANLQILQFCHVMSCHVMWKNSLVIKLGKDFLCSKLYKSTIYIYIL